jgi:hypothetical protein
LDQASLNVIYCNEAKGLMGGQKRPSMSTQMFQSQAGGNGSAESTKGKKFSFGSFTRALEAVAQRAFPRLDGRAAFLQLMNEHVLPLYDGMERRGQVLPHRIEPSDVDGFLADEDAASVLQSFGQELHRIFMGVCGSKGKAQMRYDQWQRFCEDYFYFSSFTSSSQPLLTKMELGLVFVHVCGGRPQSPAVLSFSEFMMALAVTGCTAVHGGKLREQGIADTSAVPPQVVVKWALQRMFQSKMRTERKEMSMGSFNSKFARMLQQDGKPVSYLHAYFA